MKRTVMYVLLVFIVILAGFFVLRELGNSGESTPALGSTQNGNDQITPSPQSLAPADKIEVVHFHATQQCISCIMVGKLAQKTITDKFPDEVKSGKIIFKEINIDLTENQTTVNRYKAGGSSLFVNAIRGGKDDITEDTRVWTLIGSESQYIAYFENKLETLLGR